MSEVKKFDVDALEPPYGDKRSRINPLDVGEGALFRLDQEKTRNGESYNMQRLQTKMSVYVKSAFLDERKFKTKADHEAGGVWVIRVA